MSPRGIQAFYFNLSLKNIKGKIYQKSLKELYHLLKPIQERIKLESLRKLDDKDFRFTSPQSHK